MGLSTGIMLTSYAVMRNHVGLRLGWIEPPPPRPHEERARRNERLQVWHTEPMSPPLLLAK